MVKNKQKHANVIKVWPLRKNRHKDVHQNYTKESLRSKSFVIKIAHFILFCLHIITPIVYECKTRLPPYKEMVFCFQNCSDLQCEKKMFKWLRKTFEIRDWRPRLLQKILRSLEQFVQKLKGQDNFWNRTYSWRFSDLIRTFTI